MVKSGILMAFEFQTIKSDTEVNIQTLDLNKERKKEKLRLVA